MADGMRRSDRVILEEFYDDLLKSIFSIVVPKMGITRDEIGDQIAKFKIQLPWPEADTRLMRLKEMYGGSIQEILIGAGVIIQNGKPTSEMLDKIMKGIDDIVDSLQ